MTKPRLKLNIYGNVHSGLSTPANLLSIGSVISLYIRIRSNEWIYRWNFSWSGNLLNIFLLERVPLFNWFDGKKIMVVDQEGELIGDGFLSSCPTVVQPFQLAKTITDVIIKFSTSDPVKKMLSLKADIWKIELQSGSIIYTDRLDQATRVLRLLGKKPQVFELFHATKVLVRPK
jgi:hypothetical protein